MLTQEEYIGALPAVAIVPFFFSLGVVALFAVALTAAAMRTFRRTAVR